MLLSLSIIVFLISFANAQTWESGSNVTDQAGTYNNSLGSQNVIGSRAGMSCWSDNDRTWVFGGKGFGNNTLESGYLNDLWFYDALLGTWTFVNGSTTPNAPGQHDPLLGALHPGGRTHAIKWRTRDQLWLFGGVGVGGTLNDIWAYNTTSGEWQLKGGSQLVNQPPRYNATLPEAPLNTSLPAHPGSRSCSFAWLVTPENGPEENSTLWLWGGLTGAEGAGYHNDIWKYSLLSNEWEWVAGSNGTEGGNNGAVIDAAGSPPPRACGASWVARDGALYIFGGHTVNDSVGTTFDTVKLFNDIWKFDTTTLNWTVVQHEQVPVYNKSTSGIPAPRHNPGYTADNNGNLFLFGGNTAVSEHGNDTRNDLWLYNIAENTWQWLLGSEHANATGEYNETTGRGDPAARSSSCLWLDVSDSLWLFGGGASDTQARGFRNDLWTLVEHFNPPPNNPTTSGDPSNTGPGQSTGQPTTGTPPPTGNPTTGQSGQPTTGQPPTTGQYTITTGNPNHTITTGNPVTGDSGQPTTGEPTTGQPTTGTPPPNTGNPTGQPTTGTPPTPHPTTGHPTTGTPPTPHPTTGHPTIGVSVTTGDPTTGNHTAPPHPTHAKEVIVTSVLGGVTISAGVVGIILYRGNKRFRNMFQRKDADEDAELLPINNGSYKNIR